MGTEGPAEMKFAVFIPISNETWGREGLGEMKFEFGGEHEEVCVPKIDFGLEFQRNIISEGRSRIAFYHYKKCNLIIKSGPKSIFKKNSCRLCATCTFAAQPNHT